MEYGTTKPGNLQVSASVRIAETQDGAVLLDVAQGFCFNINPVGGLILKQIREGCNQNEIAQHLVQVFNIPPEQAYNDVQEFVEDLKRKQLVHELSASGNNVGRRRKFAELFTGMFSKAVP